MSPVTVILLYIRPILIALIITLALMQDFTVVAEVVLIINKFVSDCNL